MKKWEIEKFDVINSTQKYLLKKIEKEDLNFYCVWSEFQTDGIGTKNNKWVGEKGNLFFSFVINLNEFNFVPMQSISIYFSFIMYEILHKYKNNLIIKWPNDIYIFDEIPKKIAGVLVNIKRKKIICGIGVNTKHSVNLEGEYESGSLDIDIKNDKILQDFLNSVLKKPLWEYVFNKYKKVFDKSKRFFYDNAKLNKDATLKR